MQDTNKPKKGSQKTLQKPTFSVLTIVKAKKILLSIFLVYLGTWALSFCLLLIQLLDDDRKFMEACQIIVTKVFPKGTFLLVHHILFVLLFLVFLLVRYFIKVYRKKGVKIFFKQLALRCIFPISLLFFGFKTLVHVNSKEAFDFTWDKSAMNNSGKVNRYFETDAKQRGMSVFGWRGESDRAIEALIKANVEWVTVVPFLYQENELTKVMEVPDITDSYGRRDSIFIANMQKMRAKGLYVHLKPHLWMSEGWRSNVSLDSKAEWEAWFQSYSTNMLHYAKMAETVGAELFCVGTELRSSIKEQPKAWCDLIAKIKAIYSGKLTYAANWHDEYEHIGFWDELDYIGIQAYFPLTKDKNPDLETIKKGWEPHLKTLEAFSETHKKPILFTEVGYKSEATATIKPWEWGTDLGILYQKKSDRTQQLAYEALFQMVWHQSWFAGVHIWEWNNQSTEEGAKTNLNFSPRFKPAENTIAKWFGQPQATAE